MTEAPKILLVEDDSSFREQLAFLLREQGFDVVTAAGYESARNMLDTKGIHALVTKLHLEGECDASGLALIREIRETHRTMPIILAVNSLEQTKPSIDFVALEKSKIMADGHLFQILRYALHLPHRPVEGVQGYHPQPSA